jgi:hypothetical protein
LYRRVDVRANKNRSSNNGKSTVVTVISYCKPKIGLVGGIAGLICATHFKGTTWVIEGVQSRFNPAYDLDE